MKTRYFTLVIFLVLGMVIFSNYTSKKTSEKENASLLYMLEEERLARDVYTHLYEKWETKQFGNIKESEQTHVEKVQELLDKNKIPYQVLPQGKFNNQELQKLYNDLISKGNISEIEALKVGATIEDVDIFDLQRLKKETDNQDIISVYNFLECASRNHMRVFDRGLSMRNATYKRQFISQVDFQKIIDAEHEQCGMQNGMQCEGKGRGLGKGSGRGQGNCMYK